MTAEAPILSTQTAETPFTATTTQVPADRASCDLLLATARLAGDAGDSRLCSLTEKVGDWDSLLALARAHRMLPMIFRRLQEMEPAVPQRVRERLRAEYERNVFHCLANAAELIHLLNTFNIAGIPVMPYKGIVLAASVYHDLTARPAGDLDLLIHPKHLTQATALLLELGFRQIGPFQADGTPVAFDNHEYVFERPSDGIVVELRWRLDLIFGRFRRNLDMDWACTNRRTAVVAGFAVPDMAAETTLLVLCLHGSKHVWSRLIWVCDVAQLVASSAQLDWELTMRVARQSGLWRALALGTLLAHRISGAPVPENILRRFRAVVSARRLAEHFEEHLLDQPGIGPVGLVPYNIQMLDFSDRFSPLLWLNFLRPNDIDRAAFPLPKSLRALHYLLRPLRILFSQPQK